MTHAPDLRSGRGLVAAAFVLLALGLLLTVVTAQALPLVAAAVVLAVVAHAGVIGWRLSFALVLLTGLVGQLCLAWVAPAVGGSIATDSTVVWTIAGIAHAALLARRGLPRLRRSQAFDVVAVLAGPTIVAAYLYWTARTSATPWIGWAMGGDAANNMILNRGFVDQGGLLREQGNPAPLSTVLSGTWSAPGLDDATGEGVRHLVLASGELSLLLLGLVGILGAMLALRNTSPVPGHRIVVGTVAGLLPWLWCVAGFTFAYGFQNAPPAMVILLLAWVCWLHHSTHPVASLTGQILATWAAAVCWAPMLLVPAFFMMGTVVADRRALLRAGRLLVVPGAALLAAAAYALVITLPDLRAAGGVPGFDGAHPNYDPRRSLGVAAALMVLVLVLHRRIRSEVRWGFWLALPAVALSVAQLVRARDASGLPLWGYYPIKLTWIVMAVLVVVLFSELQQPLGRWARTRVGSSGVLLAAALPITMMFLVTPPIRPVTLASAVTPVWLHDNVGSDPAYNSMFALMGQDPKTIVASYSRDGVGSDSIINFWLLESGAEDLGDPLRNPAYSMNSRDPAAICAAVATWDGGVRVVTRDKALEDALVAACPDQDFRVTVAPGAPPAN